MRSDIFLITLVETNSKQNIRRLLIILGFISLLLSFPTDAKAVKEEVELYVRNYDPSIGHKPISRAPMRKPSLFIDGYLLQIDRPCNGDIIRLVDENGNIQYSSVVDTNSNKISLPGYLTGTFEIQLIRGNFCFYGYIDL